MTAYAKDLDLTLMIDQSPGTNGAPQYGTPYQFAATADGAADGSTVVSDFLGGYTAANDTWPGWWLECVTVDEVNGDPRNLNQVRKIMAHQEAVGTVTLQVEQFPGQTRIDDTFRLIDTISVIPQVCDDTGGVATDLRDPHRAEANDYWLGTEEESGPYLEIEEADNALETTLRLITDFTQAGGIVEAALGANSAVGDLGMILCCPEWVEHGFMTCNWEQSSGRREQYHGRWLKPPDAAGRRIASGQGELLVRGPGLDRPGLRSECHRLWSSPLDFDESDQAITVNDPGAADTTTSTSYDAGNAEVGRLYASAEGSATMCTAAGTPATWSPALRVRAADDSVVQSLVTYVEPSDFLLNHHIYIKEMRGDSFVYEIPGCVPALTFSAQMHDFLRCQANFQASDWKATHKDEAGAYTRAWRAKRTSINPVTGRGGRCVYGSSEMNIKSMTLDLGIVYTALESGVEAPNGMYGYRLSRIAPRGTLVGMVDDTNLELFEDATGRPQASPFLIQYGSRSGFPGVWCFWAYRIQIVDFGVADSGGNHQISVNFEVNDHDTDTTGLPGWAIGLG